MTLRLHLISALAPPVPGFAAPQDVHIGAAAKARISALQARFAGYGGAASPSPRAQAVIRDLSVTEALRDVDFGSWVGLKPETIGPGALALWLSDPNAAPHGGESLAQALARLGNWFDAAMADHQGHMVILADALVLRLLVVHAIRAPIALCHAFDIAPLSVTELSRAGASWRLRLGSDPQANQSVKIRP